MNWTRLILTVVALVQLAGAGMMDRRIVYDSLRDVEPWQRRQWLAERGLQDYYKAQSWKPTTDSGLRCVGRWSYGPSVKVSLRATADDTIVCLARGSGASIIRFRSQDSLTLDLLSDINCNGIVSRAIIDDTLVYCGMNQGGTGIEVWGVSDLTSPHRLSYVYLPPIMDIAVKDTFLYATGYVQDSLRIFNVANPRNPVQVGACSDSGFPMCVSGDYCYLADRGGINIIDVTDPTNPHRVGKATTGGIALSVAVRDSLCFLGVDDMTLRIFNMKDPTLPYEVGSLSGIEAHDVYLSSTCDTVLYTPKLHVINIANPASPRQIGFLDCPGWDYGVVTVPSLGHALVADYFDGLVVVDVQSPSTPAIDTNVYGAGSSEDIWIDGQRAYVAQYFAGLRILDMADPASPVLLGLADTVGTRPATQSVCALDSFAFVGWTGVPFFRSFGVSDPTWPRYAGGVDIPGFPEDMVSRDSFVYLTELGGLQIVNIARPREPVLVGTLGLGSSDVWGLALQDSLAYVTSYPLAIVSVADPSHPRVVGSVGIGGFGIAVQDTLMFVAGGGLFTYSVANPAQPYLLDSLHVGDFVSAVAVADTLVYIGCDEGVRAVNVGDPVNPFVVGFAPTPYAVWRVTYDAPYVYAVCSNAGFCIFETTQTGVAERGQAGTRTRQRLEVRPSVTSDGIAIAWAGLGGGVVQLSVYDAIGRNVARKEVPFSASTGEARLRLGRLGPGAYFIEAKSAQDREIRKVLKR